MGKQLRYMGKFLSRNSVEWRVEILQGRNGQYLGRDLLQWWRSYKP